MTSGMHVFRSHRLPNAASKCFVTFVCELLSCRKRSKGNTPTAQVAKVKTNVGTSRSEKQQPNAGGTRARLGIKAVPLCKMGPMLYC